MANETKHTPGPWQNDDTLKYNQRHCIRHNGLIIALICKSAMDRTEQDAEANARLIAAAPELLEACTAAWQEQLTSNHTAETHRKLSEAIRKAQL